MTAAAACCATRRAALAFASELVAVVIVAAIAIGANFFTPPRSLPFIERDPTISFAYVDPETVPNAMLAGLAIGMPIAVIIVGHVYHAIVGRWWPRMSPARPRTSLPTPTSLPSAAAGSLAVSNPVSPVIVSLPLTPSSPAASTAAAGGITSAYAPWLSMFWVGLSFAHCMAWVFVVTGVLKVGVGRHRPNYFAYCNYRGLYREAAATGNFTAYWAVTTPGVFGDNSYCTAATRDVWDAQRSFPSGHSSTSFAGLGFMYLYLRTVFGVPSAIHMSLGSLVAASPLVLAAYVAVSRVRDRYHNIDDIAVGALLGLISAWLAWRHHEWHQKAGFAPRLRPAGVFGAMWPWQTRISDAVISRRGSGDDDDEEEDGEDRRARYGDFGESADGAGRALLSPAPGAGSGAGGSALPSGGSYGGGGAPRALVAVASANAMPPTGRPVSEVPTGRASATDIVVVGYGEAPNGSSPVSEVAPAPSPLRHARDSDDAAVSVYGSATPPRGPVAAGSGAALRGRPVTHSTASAVSIISMSHAATTTTAVVDAASASRSASGASTVTGSRRGSDGPAITASTFVLSNVRVPGVSPFRMNEAAIAAGGAMEAAPATVAPSLRSDISVAAVAAEADASSAVATELRVMDAPLSAQPQEVCLSALSSQVATAHPLRSAGGSCFLDDVTGADAVVPVAAVQA